MIVVVPVVLGGLAGLVVGVAAGLVVVAVVPGLALVPLLVALVSE